MNTFDEQDHPRRTDGRFRRKQYEAPREELVLSDEEIVVVNDERVTYDATYTEDDDTPYEVPDDTSTREERAAAWEVGAGLQQVDGLVPSRLAYELIEDQIEGRTTYDEVERELHRHYDSKQGPTHSATREADLSAVRIAQIVQEPGFTLSAGSLAAIHGRIFDGLLEDRRWEGEFRTEHITKREPVLGGDTVRYAPVAEIVTTLRWEFAQEKDLDFAPADDLDATTHVMRFISSIWQVHPFREGNTRTASAYAIKYLRSLGVLIDNEPFAKSAQYFRDALVLDNAPRKFLNREPLRMFARALAGESVVFPDLRGRN